MKNFVLLFSLCVCLNMVSAQPYPNWVNYTYNRMVTGIDIKGDNVWVSTQGGLIKYNKISGRISHYNRASANLPDNNLMDVYCAANGDVWVAGMRNGIGKLSNNVCTQFNESNSGLPSNHSNTKIKADHNGNIWVASFRYMARYDGINWKQWRTGNLVSPNPLIADFDIDANGTVWTYCTDGIGTIENEEYSIISTIGQEKISASGCVKVDKQGDVWFAINDEGLYKYNGETFTNYNTKNSCLPSNTIKAISFDQQNNMWLASAGLLKFGVDVCDTVIFPAKGLTTIKCDNDGTIWCGIFGGQFFSYNGNGFTPIEISNSPLTSNHAYPLFTDNQNNVWIGSKKNTIKSSLLGSEEVFDKEVKSGVQDSNGAIWLAFAIGDTCLLKMDGNESMVFDSINSPFNTYIRSKKSISHLHADNLNHIWVSTKGNGLYKFDGENFINYTSVNSQLPSDAVNWTVSDKDYNLWGGTSNGLFKFDGSNWTIWNTENSTLPTAEVTQLFIDSDGILWFSPWGEGLTKFDGQVFVNYNADNSGLLNNIVSGIAEHGGKMWLTGDGGGLVSFDKMNKWEAYKQSNSGITGNRAQGIIKDKNGNLWIGNWDAGISVYNSDLAIQTTDITAPRLTYEKELPLLIYPNPVKNELFVKFHLQGEKIIRAEIYDLCGKQLQVIPQSIIDSDNSMFHYNIQMDLPDKQLLILKLTTNKSKILYGKFLYAK